MENRLCRMGFNPRSPCGERRHRPQRLPWRPSVSIHAPRVGSDYQGDGSCSAGSSFNPRSPCGERHYKATEEQPADSFQSTLPVWGATQGTLKVMAVEMFQSTLPVWGATGEARGRCSGGDVSIHAPRVGSDLATLTSFPRSYVSIHAPRVGSDERYPDSKRGQSGFNPRSPCGERPTRPSSLPVVSWFQSTLPVWGATPEGAGLLGLLGFQSTLPVWGATFAGKILR